MTRHIDESVLHDFREGLLDSDLERQVREHLDACPECREELQALCALLGGLGGLPVEAQPSRDLWPQIAWRVEAAKARGRTSADATEESKPATLDSPSLGPRRSRWIQLQAWQLLAASIALMVISGASVWVFLGRGTDPGGSLGQMTIAPAHFVGWEEAYGGYDEAVADLEDVLERGREVLDPETVRVLEESLLAIDQAIQEAGEAVRADPASPVLQRFLADNLRKKMDLLRKTALAVHANTRG
jgi:hypothetical protein